MKERRDKTRIPILAAGGIVLRGDRKPHIAVVQLRKLSAWVLPKGKLAASESAIAAARREVLEETGHRVSIHEFLGTLAYEAGGRPKVVQFWRMQALGGPVRELMRDVKAVQWLPLDDAIALLTHVREQAFLEHVGPAAIRSAERAVRRTLAPARAARKTVVERVRPSIQPAVPVHPAAADHAAVAGTFESEIANAALAEMAPVATPETPDSAEPIAPDTREVADFAAMPGADFLPPEPDSGRFANAEGADTAIGRSLIEKTWVWFRQTAAPHRPRRD
jgi:8-oxo-dGTP diphosphatase